jgi:hypothetical protein
VRIVASLAAMLGLVAVGLVPAAAPSNADLLLASARVDGQQLLFRVDARTLTRTDGPTVQLPNTTGAHLRSPDGMLLVLVDNRKPVLTFVDVRAMTVVRTLRVGPATPVELAAWPRQDRLLAFVWGCCPVRNDLVVVDPTAGKVLSRRPVTGSGWPNVALPDGLVYLAAPENAIRAARVVVVDGDGRRRAVVLDRIRAGTKRRTVRGTQYADVQWPGLAADPAGRTAYVVAAGGLVAEVDLATLAVTYHSLEGAGTRRLQKSVNGPMRYAQWVGDGRIVVSGIDAKISVTRAGDQHQTWTPTGVSVIDTSAWRSRMLDPNAGGFSTAPGGVLIQNDSSFTVYDVDGRARFAIPFDEPVDYVQIVGGYAYAWGRDRTTTIVDLASGTVVARIPKPDLWLVGEG